MKDTFLIPLLALLLGMPLKAAFPEPTITETGAHHRIFATVREIQTAQGVRSQTNSYVELQTGLHRWTDQGWVETDPRIEIFQDGAVVRNLQYQVIFSPNPADGGSIDILLPDGQRLRGHLLGLAYREGNQVVFISEIKECAGQIGGAEQNELTFRDAFTDFHIDVKYVVQRGKLSQSIIIQDRLPHPREVGLSDAAHVELMTEWVNFPAPQRQQRVLEEAKDGQRALTDERIDFGSMRFIPGKAYTIGQLAGTLTGVAKSWEELTDEAGNRRTFLLEKVPWRKMEPELQKLPPLQAAALKKWQQKKKTALLAGKALPLPIRKMAKSQSAKAIQTASVIKPSKGYLVDFELAISTNSFRWKSDTTYYLSGSVLVTTNVFEGGCVLKFAPTNSATLMVDGPITFETGPYRPILFTGRDDDSCGQVVTGSTSAPGTNRYAEIALWLMNYGLPVDLKHFRFSYMRTCVGIDNTPTTNFLSHAQMIKSDAGFLVFGNESLFLRNALMSEMGYCFYTLDGLVSAEHLTVNRCPLYCSTESWANPVLRLTNSLLVAVTNIGATNLQGANYYWFTNDPGVFQTVGAGNHYLVANSPYRNVGTTNINAQLLTDLRSRTTYPPTVLSNAITLNTTLGPVAQRDTDIPDLGWSYPGVDFAANFLPVTNNITVTISPGTVIASYGDGGLWLKDGSVLVCEGTPLQRIQLVRFNAVQEQSTNWGAASSFATVHTYHSTNSAPSLRFRFTDFSLMSGLGAYHLFSYDLSNIGSLSVRDCSFGNGDVFLSGANNDTFGLTNNVFERAWLEFWDYPAISFYHNLVRGGETYVLNFGTNVWTFRDNVFDSTLLADGGGTTNSHNAYVGGVERLTPTNVYDIVLSSFNFQAGPLGNYYQLSTNFINAGSRYATNAGLYHFTTTTNQVKEGGSVVDIGFHHVAVTNGVPFDTDGEGLADYFEDQNGNGTKESTETDWNNSDTDGDGVSDYLEFLQGRNPLAGAVGDTNGIINLRIYTPLK